MAHVRRHHRTAGRNRRKQRASTSCAVSIGKRQVSQSVLKLAGSNVDLQLPIPTFARRGCLKRIPPASRTQCACSKSLIFLAVTVDTVSFCSRSFHPIRCDFVAAFWGRTMTGVLIHWVCFKRLARFQSAVQPCHCGVLARPFDRAPRTDAAVLSNHTLKFSREKSCPNNEFRVLSAGCSRTDRTSDGGIKIRLIHKYPS
ncbi:hypothetical protein V1292_004486 [Bradyrhizobium sp. AZCC 1719]